MIRFMRDLKPSTGYAEQNHIISTIRKKGWLIFGRYSKVEANRNPRNPGQVVRGNRSQIRLTFLVLCAIMPVQCTYKERLAGMLLAINTLQNIFSIRNLQKRQSPKLDGKADFDIMCSL